MMFKMDKYFEEKKNIHSNVMQSSNKQFNEFRIYSKFMHAV